MGAPGRTKAYTGTTVIFSMMFCLAFCSSAITVEMFCPPAIERKAYNITAEIHNIGEFKDVDIRATWFYGSIRVALCSFHTRSCQVDEEVSNWGYHFVIGKFGNDHIYVLAGKDVLYFTGVYSVIWDIGKLQYNRSCNVTVGDPVNECYPDSPCVNATRCLDLLVGYKCLCSSGFSGMNCNKGDLELRCGFSKYTVKLTQGADNCVTVNNSCNIAGLDYNTSLNLTYRLRSYNGSSALQVKPYVSEKAMFVTVCTTSAAEIRTYQMVYSLESAYSSTKFAMQIIAEVEEGNTPPKFNSPPNGAPYIFNVPAGTTPQEATIIPVKKSGTPTCDSNSCIQIIDPDTNPGLGINSLALRVELDYSSGPTISGDSSGDLLDWITVPSTQEFSRFPDMLQTEEDAQKGSILYKDNETSDGLGYFYPFGQLTSLTTITYILMVTDGGHSSDSATVIFNIIDLNRPPECTTTALTLTLHFRIQPETQVGVVLCSDNDAQATFQKIDYAIIGLYADYFRITDDGEIMLARAVTALNPGAPNLTVVATGYSAEPDGNYVIRIPVYIIITDPEPNCNLTITRAPDIWRVGSVAQLQLECETWGLDKLMVVSWTHADSLNVSFTKQSPTVFVLTLTVRMYTSPKINFEVLATLGGKATPVSIRLHMYNPPVFALQVYGVTITDAHPIGESFLVLSANSGVFNDVLTYRIKSGNSSSLFKVEKTGALSPTENLYPFGGSSFHLVCEVEGFSSGLTATTEVVIEVLDINEVPVCSDPGSVVIKSNLPTQRIVTNILCQDPDNLPEFKMLSYSIVISPPTVKMEIRNNGSIVLGSFLPPTVTSIAVSVNVSDSGGLSAYVDFNISVTVVTCPRETAQFDLTFPETPANSEITLNCTGKHTGQISRSCFLNETWGPFNYNNCSNEELGNINTEIDSWTANNSLTTEEVETKLKKVADDLFTSLNESSTVMPSDIKQTVEIFNKVGELTLSKTASLDHESVMNFVSTADVLFGADDNVWKETNKDYEGGAMMLEAMDSIVTAGLRDEGAVDKVALVTKHLVIATAVSAGDINFSSYKEAGHENGSDVTVQSTTSATLSKEAFSQGAVKFSVVLYRNLTDKLQINQNLQSGVLSGKVLNSDVLTFVVNVTTETLLSPLKLIFSVLQTNYSRPSCGFLDTHASVAGVWSTTGCTTVKRGDTVQCSCNHLTNFAILMSPVGEDHISSADKTALSIISVVGCGISIFCLVVTIGVYVNLWKYVKCDRSVLHINLSACLILAYIVFLAGVNRTDSEVGCKVVAALLHYLFLTVFFIMLSEGIEIFKSVSFVFSSDSILCKLIPLSYGVPLIIVAISLAVTKTEGYGGETSCWLSTTGGLIWAFVGPVLLVILINCIILIQVLRIMQSTKKMMATPAQERAKSVVRTICLLSPLLGLTWVFGVLSVNRGSIVIQYLFAIFNSLQGLFIFICYCLLTPQVRDGFKSLRRKHRAKSFDSRMVSSSSSGKFTDSRTNSSRVKNSNSYKETHTTTACESSFSETRPETELHKTPNNDGSNDANPPIMKDALSQSDRSASWHVIPLGSTDPSTRDSGHQFSLGTSDPVRSNSGQIFTLGGTDPVISNSGQIFTLGGTDHVRSNSGQILTLGGTDPDGNKINIRF